MGDGGLRLVQWALGDDERSRVEALNGRLYVDSVPGQGDLHQGGDPLRSREPVAGPAGGGG